LRVCTERPRFLPEWLEYHHLIGVQHFYLVSNDCDDLVHNATLTVLSRYRWVLHGATTAVDRRTAPGR